ncbi:PREDICTED: dehydrogenase/reductase SDR family member 1-like [Branchiostoma belcheri]|uniref:Dehydrogenase/reductase SDR family member 1-like n=1 Tax=Branchiostoma belcheri TaxID=7741 RepID=A0A6P4YXG0_BRABE|nr:PREDICTED: dehydrogenase/reductase SDR family member 1-like [Branchiostoma belcheri]XP_019628977.1 PREDICTED: dehydrogenase/reductase SDR family member 1-like [Branchiostoma belcheri]XP_019628978.1 PREDICTED: dehydrogenase/reductase SDR family member 1-like [Branchiostoma belcheri]
MLSGKIALVTGATRGIGKGIALQLGEAGATVYITGRTLQRTGKGTSLLECAEEIEKRGGKCIPVQCDHEKDDNIKALFDQIQREQNGQLDILVNNAYKAVTGIFENEKNSFWQQDAEFWDEVNNVGLRNHYVCSVYAARLMVPQKKGLIVNISSPGGLRYLFNVAYGIGKAACDRMAADCAHELRKHNVAFISLWPGAVKTELVSDLLAQRPESKSAKVFAKSETVEFAGKAIVHLAQDPNIMQKSGRILCTCLLAEEYGFTDIDGSVPVNFWTVKGMVAMRGYTGLAAWIPSFLKIPGWLLAAATHKF